MDCLFVKSKNAIIRSRPFHQSIDSTKYKNILIYPAVHKVATDEPYFTAYDYYGRCCERSQLLLTIGYSFRDYDALARLRGAMSFNPKLVTVLMAPDAKQILDKLPMECGRLRELEYPFGKDAVSYLPAIDSILEAVPVTS